MVGILCLQKSALHSHNISDSFTKLTWSFEGDLGFFLERIMILNPSLQLLSEIPGEVSLGSLKNFSNCTGIKSVSSSNLRF